MRGFEMANERTVYGPGLSIGIPGMTGTPANPASPAKPGTIGVAAANKNSNENTLLDEDTNPQPAAAYFRELQRR